MTIFEKFFCAMEKTKKSFKEMWFSMTSKGFEEDECFRNMEEWLLLSDVGVKASEELIRRVKSKSNGRLSFDNIKEALRKEMLSILKIEESKISKSSFPVVILVVGVNGGGKTTTVAKLAWRYRKEGRKVLLAVCDTYRAAGFEQLNLWAKKIGVQVVGGQLGSDSASVAYDAITKTISGKYEVLIIDTAGRIHTKVSLLDELKKIKNVVKKRTENITYRTETLLIIDATTGQNAFVQARTFHETIGIDGIIVTKLDGTAKGGIILGISNYLKIPVKMVGVGENLEDLSDFSAEEFVEAILTD